MSDASWSMAAAFDSNTLRLANLEKALLTLVLFVLKMEMAWGKK